MQGIAKIIIVRPVNFSNVGAAKNFVSFGCVLLWRILHSTVQGQTQNSVHNSQHHKYNGWA